MTSEHIVLIVGLIALAVILGTTVVFRAVKKNLADDRRVRFEAILESLDRLRFLPLMWILAAVSIGYWLVARVVISYN